MADMQNVSLSEQALIRRQKLAALQEAGNNTFLLKNRDLIRSPSTTSPTTAQTSKQILKRSRVRPFPSRDD